MSYPRDSPRAERLARKVYDARRAIYGDTHQRTFEAGKLLGSAIRSQFYDKQGQVIDSQLERGPELLILEYRNLAVALELEGATSKEARYCRWDLGRILAALDQFEEAERIYLEDIEATKIEFDRDYSLGQLVGILERSGQLEKAQRYAEELVELYRGSGEYADSIYRNDNGPRDVAIAQTRLAKILMAQEKFAEAELVARDAIEAFETAESIGRFDAEVALLDCLLPQDRLPDALAQSQKGIAALARSLAKASSIGSRNLSNSERSAMAKYIEVLQSSGETENGARQKILAQLTAALRVIDNDAGTIDELLAKFRKQVGWEDEGN